MATAKNKFSWNLMPEYRGVDPIVTLCSGSYSFAIGVCGASVLSLLLFGGIATILAVVLGYVLFIITATLLRIGLWPYEPSAKAADCLIIFASVIAAAAMLSY